MIPAAIADTIGISDQKVAAIMRESRTAENGLANPHGQRAEIADSAKPDAEPGGNGRRGRRALRASQGQLAFELEQAPAA
jgi:hypothetical protein